jgi:hypothetical protein
MRRIDQGNDSPRKLIAGSRLHNLIAILQQRQRYQKPDRRALEARYGISITGPCEAAVTLRGQWTNKCSRLVCQSSLRNAFTPPLQSSHNSLPGVLQHTDIRRVSSWATNSSICYTLGSIGGRGILMSGEKRARRRSLWRSPLKILGVILALVLLANVGIALAYRNRALPNSYLGQFNAGGQSFASLHVIRTSAILPAQVSLRHNADHTRETPGSLGISVDIPGSIMTLKRTRHWLPVVALVAPSRSRLQFRVNQVEFHKAEAALAQAFNTPAEGRHIVINGTTFSTVPGHAGYRLDSASLLSTTLLALQRSKTTFDIPTTPIPAPPDDPHLQSDIQSLQKQLSDKVSFVYQGHTMTPNKTTVASWFKPDGITMAVSEEAIESYLNNELARQFNVTLANPGDLATGTTFAVSNADPVSFAVTPADTRTLIRSYCTAVDDESSAVLAALIGKLAETYNDTRGWNDGGRIAFEHVTSGCQYTVWMTAPDQMTTFGAICDNYYNCQVGTNVIRNYDRWTTSTPPWEGTGKSLNDYRTLMINHETGHRLGFADDPTCPGSGQPAPVMMQQSIDLKGCVFNIWPRPAEFMHVDQILNIPASTPPTQSE